MVKKTQHKGTKALKKQRATHTTKVDYYPNKVPLLVATLGVTVLVLFACITTTF